MIPVDEARSRILERARALAAELIPLDDALGRVIAEDLVASLSVPRFTNAAMDGYALHARATDKASLDAPVLLDVIGESAAGDGGELVVTRQEAARIFTGAPIPRGCDAVVMQEDVTRDGKLVRLTAPVKRDSHVRQIAEDIAVGTTLLRRGTVVCAGEIAIAATQGRYVLPVTRRPRVAIIPTGNELVELDTLVTAAATKVPNSNASMLAAQVLEAGGVPLRMPIVGDDPLEIAVALNEAATTADIVVTSGGVSAGDHDHVARVVAERGMIEFHKVAMRPGKPLAFGTLGERLFFGLPGNPVSSFVSFELFVRPALRTMLAARDVVRPCVPVVLAASIKPARDRQSYVRVRLRRDGVELVATPAARQGSSDLTSIADVDGLMIIEAGAEPIAAGAISRCLLLRTV